MSVRLELGRWRPHREVGVSVMGDHAVGGYSDDQTHRCTASSMQQTRVAVALLNTLKTAECWFMVDILHSHCHNSLNELPSVPGHAVVCNALCSVL